MQGLDKWLTTDHESDKWISYYEKVAEAHSDIFFDANESWIVESDQYNDLLNKIYCLDTYDPDTAAKLIERIHSLYKL